MAMTPSSNSTSLTTNPNGSYPAPIRQGNSSAGGVGYPNANAPAPQSFEQSQLDIWGAVLRRKFIVILAALVGVGLGYLHFLKTPPKYRSEVRLAVLTQAPPKIIDGDTVPQKVSMILHKNLIISQPVLSRAIEKGELHKKEILRGEESPLGKLRSAIKIQTIEKSDELLQMSLVGPDAEELPGVINNIVDAYIEVVSQDNKAVGMEAVELIDSLKKQLVEDKDKAQSQRLQIVKGMGALEHSEDGKISNPYTQEIKSLTEQINQRKQRLFDTVGQLSQSITAVQSADETQMKVLAIEARKHLNLSYDEVRKSDSAKRMDALTLDLKQLDHHIGELTERIVDLDLTLKEALTKIGPGHSQIRTMKEKISFYREQLKESEREKQEIVTALSSAEDSKDGEGAVNWDQLQLRTEERWIKMYMVALEREQNRLTSSLNELENQLGKVKIEAARISGQVEEVNMLDSQIDDKRKAIGIILERLSEMNLLSQNYTTTKVRVLDNPSAGVKVDPSLIKSLGIGTLLLTLLGVGLALLVDRADLSFHNPTEIFSRVDVPVVGRLPRLKLTEGKSGEVLGSNTLVAANHPNSSGAEAFRTIRTHLFFDAATNGTKSIMVTSPSPGDGKSTVACNLAVSIAQTGKRVVLIDGDMRRPRVHQHFGLTDKKGLMSVLKGESSLKDALHSTFLPNLFILPCGARPKNPGEVVTSQNFAKVLDMLRNEFDFVILDTPPVIPVADPTSIATLVDGVYLVFRIRRGVKVTATRAKESLAQVNARLLGVVVNGLDENPHYNDYGGYYYQYPSYGNYGRIYQERMEREYREDKDTD